MALLDFLKNKKEKDRAAEKKSVVLEKSKTQTNVEPVRTNINKKIGSFSYEAVYQPHISEKGTYLSEANKYVFKIHANANKPEIKKSVEGIYGVNVLAVNMINSPKKKRRLGRTEGFKKGFKKAIVTIKEGQKIEIF